MLCLCHMTLPPSLNTYEQFRHAWFIADKLVMLTCCYVCFHEKREKKHHTLVRMLKFTFERRGLFTSAALAALAVLEALADQTFHSVVFFAPQLANLSE